MRHRQFTNIDYSADIPEGAAFRKDEVWAKISFQKKGGKYSLLIKIAMTLFLLISAGGLYDESNDIGFYNQEISYLETFSRSIVQERGLDNKPIPLADESTVEVNSYQSQPMNKIKEDDKIIVFPKKAHIKIDTDVIVSAYIQGQLDSLLAVATGSEEILKHDDSKKELSSSAKAMKNVLANVNEKGINENYAVESSTFKRFKMGRESTPPLARTNKNEVNAFNYIIYGKNNKD